VNFGPWSPPHTPPQTTGGAPTLKHLLAAEACQAQTEDAYYGPLVWRLLAGLVLLYTVRFRLKDRVTMEEIVFSLKHHWRFVTSESLE
jgi:hypothetical protein